MSVSNENMIKYLNEHPEEMPKYLSEHPKALGLIEAFDSISSKTTEAILSRLDLNQYDAEELQVVFQCLPEHLNAVNLAGNNLGTNSLEWIQSILQALPVYITKVNLRNNHFSESIKESIITLCKDLNLEIEIEPKTEISNLLGQMLYGQCAELKPQEELPATFFQFT